MTKFIAVFVATAIADVVWTRYIQHVGQGARLRASAYAAAIILVGGFATIEYTTDPWMLVPAALGAFVGTFFTVRR